MPERDPDINPVCARCGADAMIPDVFIQAKNIGTIQLQVGLNTRPNAALLKRPVLVDTTASVCGECGNVELLASDPAALWDAHMTRLMGV